MRNSWILLIIICIIPLVIGEVEIGFGEGTGQTGVEIFLPETPTSSITNNTNSSEFWITDIGVADTVNDTQFNIINQILTLDTSWLTNFISSIGCLITGCNMTGPLNVTGDIEGGTFTLNGTAIDDWSDVNGSVDSNIYKIYFNHSMNNVITYNLTKSDANVVTVHTVGGQREIYGSDFE